MKKCKGFSRIRRAWDFPPEQILAAFLKNPAGKLLRVQDDAVYVVPAYAATESDRDAKRLIDELSVPFEESAAERLPDVVEWLQWCSAYDRGREAMQ